MFNIKDRTDKIIHCSTGSKLRRRDCEGVRQCGRKMVLITAAAVGCCTFTGAQSTKQHFRDRPPMSLTSFCYVKKSQLGLFTGEFDVIVSVSRGPTEVRKFL